MPPKHIQLWVEQQSRQHQLSFLNIAIEAQALYVGKVETKLNNLSQRIQDYDQELLWYLKQQDALASAKEISPRLTHADIDTLIQHAVICQYGLERIDELREETSIEYLEKLLNDTSSSSSMLSKAVSWLTSAAWSTVLSHNLDLPVQETNPASEHDDADPLYIIQQKKRLFPGDRGWNIYPEEYIPLHHQLDPWLKKLPDDILSDYQAIYGNLPSLPNKWTPYRGLKALSLPPFLPLDLDENRQALMNELEELIQRICDEAQYEGAASDVLFPRDLERLSHLLNTFQKIIQASLRNHFQTIYSWKNYQQDHVDPIVQQYQDLKKDNRSKNISSDVIEQEKYILECHQLLWESLKKDLIKLEEKYNLLKEEIQTIDCAFEPMIPEGLLDNLDLESLSLDKIYREQIYKKQALKLDEKIRDFDKFFRIYTDHTNQYLRAHYELQDELTAKKLIKKYRLENIPNVDWKENDFKKAINEFLLIHFILERINTLKREENIKDNQDASRFWLAFDYDDLSSDRDDDSFSDQNSMITVIDDLRDVIIKNKSLSRLAQLCFDENISNMFQQYKEIYDVLPTISNDSPYQLFKNLLLNELLFFEFPEQEELNQRFLMIKNILVHKLDKIFIVLPPVLESEELNDVVSILSILQEKYIKLINEKLEQAVIYKRHQSEKKKRHEDLSLLENYRIKCHWRNANVRFVTPDAVRILKEMTETDQSYCLKTHAIIDELKCKQADLLLSIQVLSEKIEEVRFLEKSKKNKLKQEIESELSDDLHRVEVNINLFQEELKNYIKDANDSLNIQGKISNQLQFLIIPWLSKRQKEKLLEEVRAFKEKLSLNEILRKKDKDFYYKKLLVLEDNLNNIFIEYDTFQRNFDKVKSIEDSKLSPLSLLNSQFINQKEKNPLPFSMISILNPKKFLIEERAKRAFLEQVTAATSEYIKFPTHVHYEALSRIIEEGRERYQDQAWFDALVLDGLLKIRDIAANYDDTLNGILRLMRS